MALSLNAHPRLYVSRLQLDGLRRPARLPLLRKAAAQVTADAQEFLKKPEPEYARNVHNELLLRARVVQTRVVTLLTRFFQTGEPRYRQAALDDVRAMGEWEYWSWITWRQNNPDPMAIFDLSYGENSATLAIAYDWLHDTLSDEQRSYLRHIARRRSLQPFLHRTDPKQPKLKAWWHGHPSSNWNSVCAGGAGMLALAMYQSVPEAPEVVRRVEQSLIPYMKELDKTDGAWPEGVGYWNYGMRYAAMYLLSHERATGRRHPLLERPATRRTLYFPVDFTPNDVACSFGDVNHWSPLPFHYALAQRLRAPGLVRQLSNYSSQGQFARGSWPSAAESLLLIPPKLGRPPAPQRNVIRLYRGQEWGILADRLPDPTFYMAVRGGTTEVPHGHLDLLSFHCVVGDEGLITNLGPPEYLDTTFSPRRWELFEMNPSSKNTILINGVGITTKSSVKTTKVNVGGLQGYRIEATQAMGLSRDSQAAAAFCGRLFLLLNRRAALIVDRVELPHVGRVEARMHSLAKVTFGRERAVIKGRQHRLAVGYASNVPAALHQALTAPTTPGKPATVLRWCTQRQHRQVSMITLLAADVASAPVSLTESDGRLNIQALERRIVLSRRLRPVSNKR